MRVGPAMTQDDHSVSSREKPRPEKCRAGVAMNSMPATLVRSFQSSSMIRVAGTPQRSRCAPTPSGTRNGAACRSTRFWMDSMSRWS